MAQEADYKFEQYEEYFGGVEEVMRQMDECKVCGSRLVFNHLPDYKNLLIQESARCLECGHDNRKIIHILN
ncbi:MAG: hypothetical protein ACOCUH_03755 [Bacteriovoracia bacterium]